MGLEEQLKAWKVAWDASKEADRAAAKYSDKWKDYKMKSRYLQVTRQTHQYLTNGIVDEGRY